MQKRLSQQLLHIGFYVGKGWNAFMAQQAPLRVAFLYERDGKAIRSDTKEIPNSDANVARFNINLEEDAKRLANFIIDYHLPRDRNGLAGMHLMQGATDYACYFCADESLEKSWYIVFQADAQDITKRKTFLTRSPRAVARQIDGYLASNPTKLAAVLPWLGPWETKPGRHLFAPQENDIAHIGLLGDGDFAINPITRQVFIIEPHSPQRRADPLFSDEPAPV